jgi:hypothetical protein
MLKENRKNPWNAVSARRMRRQYFGMPLQRRYE